MPNDTIGAFKKFIMSKAPEEEISQLNYTQCAIGTFYSEVLGEPIDTKTSSLFEKLAGTGLLYSLNQCKTYKEAQKVFANVSYK